MCIITQVPQNVKAVRKNHRIYRKSNGNQPAFPVAQKYGGDCNDLGVARVGIKVTLCRTNGRFLNRPYRQDVNLRETEDERASITDISGWETHPLQPLFIFRL